MIRAFIAADLPAPILEGLRRVSDELRELGVKGRFAKPGSLHLTLKFLGNIEPARVEAIAGAVERTVAEFSPFQIDIRGMGAFPGLTRPRVAWVGVGNNRDLKALQAALEEELAHHGFAPDDRDFKPHLTLLRLKSQRNIRELARYLEGPGADLDLGAATVDRVHLYQSLLKPLGAEYRMLATLRLGR